MTGGIAESSTSQKARGKRKTRPDCEEAGEAGESEGTLDNRDEGHAPQRTERKTYPNHKVRTSLKDRTLDSMFPVAHPSQKLSNDSTEDGIATPATPPVNKEKDINESQCFLTSIKDLRTAVVCAKHSRQRSSFPMSLTPLIASLLPPTELSEILSKHTFVGIVDSSRCLSLVQHSTRLYLLNHGALSAELFYQLGLRQFGNFARIRLDPPPELRMLVALAVDAEEGVKEGGLDRDAVVDVSSTQLYLRSVCL